MHDPRSVLSNENLQAIFLAEGVIQAADVGFLIWDDDRRYLAANACACELLGCTLEQIIGSVVGERTVGGYAIVASVVRGEHPRGRVTVERFDGAGQVVLDYVSFKTRVADLTYMGSVIWAASDEQDG